jgi:hypothetical protein
MAAKHRNSSLLQILPDHASDLLGADTSARGCLLTQVNLDTTEASDANVNFGISVFVLKHDVRAKSSNYMIYGLISILLLNIAFGFGHLIFKIV